MIQKLVIALIWAFGFALLDWVFSQTTVDIGSVEEILWFCLSASAITLVAQQLNSKPLVFGWSFYCLGLLLDIFDEFLGHDLVPLLVLDTSLKSLGFVLVCYGMLLLLSSKKVTIAKLNLEIASRKQLEDKLRYEAHHDPLTQLGNRKACFARFSNLSEQYQWLYYFDLDNFKQANDTYGHHVGDEVLEKFAHALIKQFDKESVFRLGGDEFVAFSNHSPDECKALRSLINPPLLEYQVDVSIGSAETDKHQEPDKILQMADNKMYKDKSRTSSRSRSAKTKPS
ncbi:GGDEF domain-containing protein [Pseudoalteromonas sp. T1lg23B]|uniref:GGDEF domain-containing protein n=1 Tax=Pseudoalteromonas sp. T1lg23B TaxID=2077097 RepID=UPI000CF6B229|nr:GGDEF domain-containing protein [Pseudoalteromonas sp. T1lg23B]